MGDVSSQANLQSFGTAKLSALLHNATPQLLQVSGTFTNAKLQPFVDLFDLTLKVDNQPGTVSVSGSVLMRLAAQPDAWTAFGRLELPEVKLPNTPSGSIAQPQNCTKELGRLPMAMSGSVRKNCQLTGKEKWSGLCLTQFL